MEEYLRHRGPRPEDLLRFSKEGGDFVHRYYGDMEAWEMFVCLRKAYDLDLLFKKRAS